MASERTEPATPKKLREARRRGDVWQSRDLPVATTLLGAAGVLGITGGSLLEAHATIHAMVLEAIAGDVLTAPGALLEASIAIAARALAPLFITVVVLGALSSFVQVGPLVAPRALAWDFARLDPTRGTRQLVRPHRAVDLAKSIAVIALVGAVAWSTLADAMHGTLALATRGPLAALETTGTLVRALLLRTGLTMLAIAILDVLYQRWRWHRDQRMTKEEVAREHKETEGDPHLRRERDRVRREGAEHDALESLRSAQVLVASSDLAIALRFDEATSRRAPEVVASGRDELARRLVREAHAISVPVVLEPALALALASLPVGAEIPEPLYRDVARVLRTIAEH